MIFQLMTLSTTVFENAFNSEVGAVTLVALLALAANVLNTMNIKGIAYAIKAWTEPDSIINGFTLDQGRCHKLSKFYHCH